MECNVCMCIYMCVCVDVSYLVLSIPSALPRWLTGLGGFNIDSLQAELIRRMWMTNTVPTNSHPMRFIVINHYQVYEMKWYMCIIDYTWLVVSNIFPYMGWHPSHWRTPSFFKMVKLHHQPDHFDWAIFNSFLYVYQRVQVLPGFDEVPEVPFSPPRCCCNAGYTWSKEQRKCQSDTPEEEEKYGRGNCCAKLGKRWGKSAFFFGCHMFWWKLACIYLWKEVSMKYEWMRRYCILWWLAASRRIIVTTVMIAAYFWLAQSISGGGDACSGVGYMLRA